MTNPAAAGGLCPGTCLENTGVNDVVWRLQRTYYDEWMAQGIAQRVALVFLCAVTTFGGPARPMIPKILRSLLARRQALAPVMADDDRKRRDSGGPGTAVITKTKPATKRPNLYRVLILNDDYTPMEFVVHVLERFFNKDREAATRIMLHVHHHGIGECGIFTYEVAETKVTQVMDFARKHHHPLQCVMEKK